MERFTTPAESQPTTARAHRAWTPPPIPSHHAPPPLPTPALPTPPPRVLAPLAPDLPAVPPSGESPAAQARALETRSLWSSALLSALLHACVLTGLAVWVFDLLPGTGDEILLDVRVEADVVEAVQLDTSALESESVSFAAGEPGVPMVAASSDAFQFAPDLASVEGGVRTQARRSSILGDISGDLLNAGPAARFFGTIAYGDRFVFVFDISGSMNDGRRFPRALEELLAAINDLEPDQYFSVALFSTKTRFLFDERVARAKLIPATDENKERASRWLKSVRPTGWTDPRPALSFALRQRASAVFLLSDGEFQTSDEPRLGGEVLRRAKLSNRYDTPMHTIAFEDATNAKVLQTLSERSGGVYRFVPPEE